MHDLNLNLFYKTSFDIEATGPKADALWAVVLKIRAWMCGKWEGRGVSLARDLSAWSRLKTGGRLESADAEKSVRLDSAAFWTGAETGLWACTITETELAEDCAPRQWVTEIGFEKRSLTEGALSLVLTYGDRPGFIGRTQPAPGVTLPGIVQRLLRDPQLVCTVSGIPVALGPIGLVAGDFARFWEMVSNPAREVPVVYVSPRFERGLSLATDASRAFPYLLVDPAALAYALGPSAVVCYSLDEGFCEEMACGLPDRQLRCEQGFLRVYAARPNFDEKDDCLRHRFFSARVLEEEGSGEVVLMLRRALAQDVNFYERMVRVDVVRRKLALSLVKREAKKLVTRAEDAALSEIEKTEQELRVCQMEKDEVESERDELRDVKYRLQAQVDNLRCALEAQSAGAGHAPDFGLGPWPLSPQQVMDVFLAAYPDRLALTERGRRSLDACRCSVEVLWNALHDLANVAHDLLASAGGVDAYGEFNRRSTFKLVPGPGMMTSKDAKLMRGYEDTFGGRPLECGMHLKSGSKESDPGFIRVYFGVDGPSGRLVISSCGKHLDNYSTRKLK